MHRVITRQGHPRYDHFRLARGRDGVRVQGVFHDAIVDFRIDRAVVQLDAGTSRRAFLHSITKALDDVCLTRAFRVLQGNQEAPRWGLIILVVPPTPRIDVHNTIRCNNEVARMPDVVSEHGRAETGRQDNSTVVALTRATRQCDRGLRVGCYRAKGRKHPGK